MVFTPSRESGSTPSFLELLEASYEQRNLVHLPAGSRVPLLKKSVWLVVRGMVKLSSLSIQGDELLLGLAGPNEPFGAPLSNVEVYEASTLCDSDLLCLSCDEIAAAPHLAMALLQGMGARSRFQEGLAVSSDDWSAATLPSWIDSIAEGARRPGAILGLGPGAVAGALREAPTILLMHWAFATGLMQFGVFRGQKPGTPAVAPSEGH